MSDETRARVRRGRILPNSITQTKRIRLLMRLASMPLHTDAMPRSF